MARTILVADPDPRVPVAYASILRDTDFAVAGFSVHGKALIDDVFRLSPWAVGVDLALPDHPAAPSVGWVATVAHLHELAPHVATYVTFAPEQRGLVPSSLAGGARSYAEKPLLRDELLAALHHLTTGRPAAPFFARARRVPRSLAIRYRPASSGTGNTSVARVGLIRNLSETGLRIATPDALTPRSVLVVDIELPDRSTIRARAQVVREILAVEKPGLREYGLAIFDLDAVQRERLKGFIGRVLAGEAAVKVEAGPGSRTVPIR